MVKTAKNSSFFDFICFFLNKIKIPAENPCPAGKKT